MNSIKKTVVCCTASRYSNLVLPPLMPDRLLGAWQQTCRHLYVHVSVAVQRFIGRLACGPSPPVAYNRQQLVIMIVTDCGSAYERSLQRANSLLHNVAHKLYELIAG